MDITIGIMAEEEEIVADANPRWIKIRKAAIIAIKEHALLFQGEGIYKYLCEPGENSDFLLSNMNPVLYQLQHNNQSHGHYIWLCKLFQSIIPREEE